MRSFFALTAILSFSLLHFFSNGVFATPLRYSTGPRQLTYRRDVIPENQATKSNYKATLYTRSLRFLPESELIDITTREDYKLQANNTETANPISNIVNGAAKAVGSVIQGAANAIKSGYDAVKGAVNSGIRSAVNAGRTIWDAITGQGNVLPQGGLTTLSASALSSLSPFTQFARAAYCPTNKLKNWSCGGACTLISEVHILSPGNAVVCPGDDDNTDAQCTDTSVPNILAGNVLDHLGPYEGINIGTAYCT